MRRISLALFLFAFWLALSGHYTPFLVAVGFGCTLLGVWLANRMRILDVEGHPIEVLARAIGYAPWLIWQIVKSGIGVAKLILHPRLPISPTMTVVRARQRTPVGIATFANSITLTPGTVTTKVSGNELMVHALTRTAADDLEAGQMNERVRQFEAIR